MTVKGIKLETLFNKLKSSDLGKRDVNRISLFIDIAASKDGDSKTLSNEELPELIKDLKMIYKEDAAKILSVLGLSSGVIQVEEIESDEKQQKEQKKADITKPGARWTTFEHYKNGNNETKITSAWERQADGTSVKITPGLIYSQGKPLTVRLRSHYQKDDKTPIEIQSVQRLGSVNVVVTKNYNSDETVKSKSYNLDHYNKYKSVGTANLAYLLPLNMEKNECKYSVVKDKNGNEILRYQNKKFYSPSSSQNIKVDKAYDIIEAHEHEKGLTYSLIY